MALPAPAAGSTVVVTGASSGIGAELARELSRRGHHVTLVARRRDRLEALARELPAGAEVRPCDLADAGAREELAGALAAGDVVGLCNNAGFGSHGPFDRADLDHERGMVELNVAALHHLTGALLPRLIERGGGAILNVASLAANQPIPNMATYAATKAFVTSFSEALHAELRGTGVSVTSLLPGPVHTEFGAVAGVTFTDRGVPHSAYVDAVTVARRAVRGMERGRRVVVPTLKWKVTGLAGRLVPRSAYLPLARRVG
ncbi:MAG TPA: SDR family oxidoreductase [Solirubrobacteraceae bacterium]|nr:SDR family oxidoreductase [Solirubrobacteraceae bacterium]